MQEILQSSCDSDGRGPLDMWGEESSLILSHPLSFSVPLPFLLQALFILACLLDAVGRLQAGKLPFYQSNQ